MQNYDLEYDLEAIKNNPILADLLKWQSINAYNDYNRDIGAFFNDLGRYGFSTVFDCGTLDNSELAQVVFYILDNDINCNNETGMDTINILVNDHILREQLSKFILYTLKPHIKHILDQFACKYILFVIDDNDESAEELSEYDNSVLAEIATSLHGFINITQANKLIEEHKLHKLENGNRKFIIKDGQY